jgi:type III secretion protein J
MNTTFLLSRFRIVALLAVVLLTGCKETIDLQAGLTDIEANEIVASLHDDGIAAKKRTTKDGVAVSIQEQDLPRATAVLNARGLPHRREQRLGDVFKKEGMISTPMEERARYISALSQELESTIAQIDGVVVARVHVVLPEKMAPGEPLQPPTAAVFVKHTAALDPDLISSRVRQLVARSIPGLGAQSIDKVTVVFVPAVEPAKPRDDGTATSIQTVLAVVAALLTLFGVITAFGKDNWFAGAAAQIRKILAVLPKRNAQAPAAVSAEPVPQEA